SAVASKYCSRGEAMASRGEAYIARLGSLLASAARALAAGPRSRDDRAAAAVEARNSRRLIVRSPHGGFRAWAIGAIHPNPAGLSIKYRRFTEKTRDAPNAAA